MSVTAPARSDVLGIRVRLGIALGALVVVAAAVHTLIALRSPSPWIIPDELIYSELAKSLGSGQLPSIRGDVSFDYGLGYPLVLAPVWALSDDVGTAYSVAKALNALVMSSAAVPTYFLARRFVSHGYALVAAALAVSVPSLLYSGTLMTEVALYPAFLLALLAMCFAMERATVGAQLLALGAILLACSVKTISVVLLLAYPLSIVLLASLDARGRTWLRRFLPTWVSLGTLVLFAAVAAVVAGHRPYAVLGGYSSVVEHMRPTAVPGWILAHAGELSLAAAVIPVAASIVVAVRGCRRAATVNERLFIALLVPVSVCWLIAVGAFASVPFLTSFEYPENVQRLQGRSTFMLAPLFFIGFAMWLADRRGGRTVLVVAAASAVVLPVFIPVGRLDANVRFQALPLVPFVEIADDAAARVALLACALALGLVFVIAHVLRASTMTFVALVLCTFAVVGAFAHASMLSASDWTRDAAAGGSLTWVDEAPGESEVSVVWAEKPGSSFVDLERRHRVLFIGELFNRRVGKVYELGSSPPYDLPSTPARLGSDGVLRVDGRTSSLGELVLVPCHVQIAGRVRAVDRTTGARVVEVSQPPTVGVENPESCQAQ